MAKLNSPTNPGFALRDYHHAAKTFTQEPGYTKTPYTGFNFHVNISFNNLLGKLRNIETKDISMLVRAADLPETQFETETLNQYNRKRIVNKRVVYQPIKIEFHDDIANNVRNMWIAYNQHYNADSKYTLSNTWSIDDVYSNYSLNRRYGLDNGNSIPFITKLEIASMGNNEYSKMLLVNPIISSAQFDDHDYSEAAKTMKMTLTIEYENIIYSAGTTDQLTNFGANNLENYDQNQSVVQPVDLSNSVSDRVIEPTVSTPQQLSAAQFDPISGNVNKSNSGSQNLVTREQYNQIRRLAVTESQSRDSAYKFPNLLNTPASAQQLNLSERNAQTGAQQITLSSQRVAFSTVTIDDATVVRNENIESNGGNISKASVSNSNDTNINVINTSNTTVTAISTNDGVELIVNPIIPSNLNPAERELFLRSYPPLPSTDRRASSAPYV